MANHTTGAQRYNARLDKIWQEARNNGTIKAPTETMYTPCAVCGGERDHVAL